MLGRNTPTIFAALPRNDSDHRVLGWVLGIVVAGEGFPLSAELYRAYAQECLHFASGMETPTCRAVLLHMANTWLRLAQQAEKNAGHQPVTTEGPSNGPEARDAPCRSRALPGLDQKVKNGDAAAMQRVIEAGG